MKLIQNLLAISAFVLAWGQEILDGEAFLEQTLADMTSEYDNHTLPKEAYLEAARKVIGEDFDVSSPYDNEHTANNTKDLDEENEKNTISTATVDQPNQEQSGSTNQNSTTNAVEPILAIGSPADPSFWDLVKEQIRNDFAPFLILIPAPLKILIKDTFASLGRGIGNISYGAFGGLLSIGSKLLRKFSQILVLGADLVDQKLASRAIQQDQGIHTSVDTGNQILVPEETKVITQHPVAGQAVDDEEEEIILL